MEGRGRTEAADRARFAALDAILLHPTVQRTAAQTQGLGGLADIAGMLRQGFADQNILHRFQAHFVNRIQNCEPD